MPCTVDPTPQEIEASRQAHKILLQKAIAHDEMVENWCRFQEELCEFLEAYNGSLLGMSRNPELIERFPRLTQWMKDHVAADNARKEKEAAIAEMREKIQSFDDQTLELLGVKRL